MLLPRPSRTSVLAILVMAFTFGCAEPEPTLTRKPILHAGDGSEAFLDEFIAALLEEGIRAERRALTATPLAERGNFATTETEGWLLLVAPSDAPLALDAFSTWVAMRGTLTDAPSKETPPLLLGEAGALSPKRIQEIRSELLSRVEYDQAVRSDPNRHGEMARVDADNRAWLMQLVSEIGWIDATRFGRDGAGAAFLLVQHSGDVALMGAALPEIEKDVRTGRLDGQPYALLYDRMHLMTGGRQRYGTQVVVKEDGREIVERLEDPDRVDECRRAIGLGSLTEYLEGLGGDVQVER